MEILETLKQKVSKQTLTLVFPEGNDSRVVNAAVRLAKEELLTPIVLGSKEQVQAHSREPLPQNLQVLDPETYPKEEFDKLVAAFVERRKGKNTPEQAAEMLKDVNYFGTMLVYLGQADGMVRVRSTQLGRQFGQLYRSSRQNQMSDGRVGLS